MNTKRNSKDSASILLCVLGVIVILSVIGATVLRSSTARLNTSTNQVRAWKQALSAAETGGDVAFAEIRKGNSADLDVRSTQWKGKGWTQSPSGSTSTYISPSPTPGSSDPVSQSVVEKCYFDASGVFQLGTNPAGNTWYRVRSKGTVPLPGLKRTGMDDALIADGQKHFAEIGSTEMQDITARGKGDSLLRKIDFQYDHFIATYGPLGDGVGKSQVAASLAPSISRRIEQIVAPVTPFFDAAIKTAGNFTGLGSAAQIDSYNSKIGSYVFVANNPADPRYPDSRHGSVQLGKAVATIFGTIYGDLATNGGTVTKKTTNVYGSIDNNVPFTLVDYRYPDALSARLPEAAGTGAGQLPNSVTSNNTLTPPNAGTASAPVYYAITDLTKVLTVNPATAGTDTYVAIRITGTGSGGGFQGNSAGITVNPYVHLQVYFDGNVDVKGTNLVNQNPSATNPLAGNLQFYGVSPPRDADGNLTRPQTVNLDSGTPSILAMTFYAPSANVEIKGNPDFIGTVVANTFYGNGNVSWHYDRALNSVGETLDFRIASYVEDTR